MHPNKFPAKTTRIKVVDFDSKDTTIIHFSGAYFQPEFTNINNAPVQKPFVVESVLFKNRNGILLNGWLIKPADSGKINITLLHFHGNEGSLVSQYQAIVPVVKDGVQVFMFDYSGFGFSAGEATMQNVRADALAALNYITGRADVKNTKLVIYGQSLGGHLAAVIAADKPDKIAGLVMEGAFSSPKDMAAYTVRKSTGLGFIGRLLVKEDYSAKASIKKYRKPCLIIHSTEDEEVPFYMGQLLYKDANTPKEFYQIKGAHINGPRIYADSILTKIKSMLQQ
ncbi:alpha/beta hydrolase [Mucilaginibacter sp.]|uniref:alpha/beta hydrolase n=1 Tax=Mucilaginibacter sp. TaxID=1882438 RepID=UPI003B0054A8